MKNSLKKYLAILMALVLIVSLFSGTKIANTGQQGKAPCLCSVLVFAVFSKTFCKKPQMPRPAGREQR